MANRIQLRRDTAANWTRVNPVLEDGEPGLEIDTNYVKYGDGNTPWTELPYASADSVTFELSTIQEGSGVTSITGNTGVGVSLTSDQWAQLLWVPSTSNVTIGDINNGAGVHNWIYVENSGTIIENDTGNVSYRWEFKTNGSTTIPGDVQIGNIGSYGNISFVDTISANNYVYANGVSILDGIVAGGSNYGDSNVATYLSANPPAGTYSNTNVAAYLSSGSIETAWIHGNLTVGNLTVTGNSTVINTESYVVTDNIIQMANANPGDSLDLGFVAHRTVNGTLEHTGLIRDASNGSWILFSNVTAQPGNTVDFTDAVYDNLQIGGLTAGNTSLYSINFTSSPLASSSPGIQWNNGFQSRMYGNTEVAAYLVANPPTGTYSNANVASYLVANPQGSTYSNTNVAAYLLGSITTGNITSTSVAAGHLVMSGTAPDTTLGDLGDLQSELRADTNYLYVSTGAYGGSNIATPTLTVVGPVDQNYYGTGHNRVRLSGVTSEYWTDIRTSPTVYWFSAVTAIPATYVSDDGAGVFSLDIGSRSGYAGSTQYIVYATGTSIWKTIPLTSFQTPAFGNANVAAYLAANPQASGTYSNTNVAAYLTTASITTTGNISAGNVIGTHHGNAIGTTATYTGNVTAANFIGNIIGNVTGTITGNVTGTTPNVQVVAGSYTSTFTNTGTVTMPNVTVTGNVTASGIAPFYAPNRPAFRVTGPGGQIAAVTQVTGGNLVVDFNQGSYLNTTTGYFTAPVAGLYQVNLVVRTYTNAGASAQAVIEKNDSTVIIMVEWATNTTMNHTGGSTVIKLAVGDTLRFRVLLGSISFDANDNWSVAYIG